jgi:antitoxin component HigA of HigAB toxin-antitoxin module
MAFPDKAPETYAELVKIWAPRKIRHQKACDWVFQLVQWLALRAENQDQADYLELISNLIMDFEETFHPPETPATPLELLKFLVEENDISNVELAQILDVDPSLISRILSGERMITVDHAARLSARFSMQPTAFLDAKRKVFEAQRELEETGKTVQSRIDTLKQLASR